MKKLEKCRSCYFYARLNSEDMCHDEKIAQLSGCPFQDSDYRDLFSAPERKSYYNGYSPTFK